MIIERGAEYNIPPILQYCIPYPISFSACPIHERSGWDLV